MAEQETTGTREGTYEEMKDVQLREGATVTLRCAFWFRDLAEIARNVEEMNEIIAPDRIWVVGASPLIGQILLRYRVEEDPKAMTVETIKMVLDRLVDTVDIRYVKVAYPTTWDLPGVDVQLNIGAGVTWVIGGLAVYGLWRLVR